MAARNVVTVALAGAVLADATPPPEEQPTIDETGTAAQPITRQAAHSEKVRVRLGLVGGWRNRGDWGDLMAFMRVL